ncbi:MAG: antifreeze protein [Pseudomonadota bacterium]
MKPLGDPFSIWRLSLEGAFLFAEAWSVITLRTMSMSGMRPMSPEEPLRMMIEKPPAFLASGVAAYVSAASGRSAEDILTSSLRPLRREARANRSRLSGASAEPPARTALPSPR